MEGLIPYIYRALKKRRNRKYYKATPSGAAQWFGQSQSFRILRPRPIKLGSGDDHMPEGLARRSHSFKILRPSPLASPDDRMNEARRQQSRGDLAARSHSFKIPRLPPFKLGGRQDHMSGSGTHQQQEEFSGELSSPVMLGRQGHVGKDERHGSRRFLACVLG